MTYLDHQDIDTTTPTGGLLFQITGAFSEFECSMIRQRVRAGLSVVKEKLARDGKFTLADQLALWRQHPSSMATG